MAKILLVDDDPEVVLLATTVLESGGHDVISTDDPRQVLRLAITEEAQAIVLDVVLPEMSGLEVLEQLRAAGATRRLPILMLSSRNEVDDRLSALRKGADDYLGKPYHPSEFLARIDRLIETADRFLPGTLEGDLTAFSPSDLIQHLSLSEKTGRLELSAGGASGWLDFLDGKLIRARVGQLEGREAALCFVGLEKGRFRFRVGLSPSSLPSAEIPINQILLEHAWAEDELRLRAEHLPALSVPLAVRGDLPQLPSRFDPLPLEAVFRRLETFPGTTLGDLKREALAAECHLALAVAVLAEAGAVQAAA